ncbi:MAG TPA: glycosyltransferase family 39 protein [Leptolyngbyaceae cyanobacterium M33_DOE_097]|uniref:Uncharacterized protein n=1 Tax=Oscillatoriales cyanobacterium SpSt-418 TaxID=2282169 RepID=A0A7C3PSZ4_9CYAN|nr:glycosyltransferase family 39 protein [Leptolyngbyaceae cyanobacterium M33_DOE_097]
MQHRLPLLKHPLPRLIEALLVITLLIGIGLRFVHLDRKPYWVDETYTSLRVSGHTETEFVSQFYTGVVTPISTIRTYQQVNPDRSVTKTLESLALESPQHSPLYSVLAHWWMTQFGSAIAIPRLLSAILSLLLIPAMYWLCWELFGTTLAAWIGTLLVSVSPFHLLYAQEARSYSLWAGVIGLTSAALLYALRLETTQKPALKAWGAYTLTVALALYTFVFSIFVLLAHGCYILLTQSRSRPISAYLLASLVGISTFTPWIWVILQNWNKLSSTTEWTGKRTAFGQLLQRWLVNTGNVFVDGNWGYRALTVPTLLVLALVGFAFYVCIRELSRDRQWFILLLTLIPALGLILPDLVGGGIRSIHPRYFTPTWLGVELAVIGLLATRFDQSFKGVKPWRIILVILVCAGLVSGGAIAQADTWWNKDPAKHPRDREVAALLNQAAKPLVLSDDSTSLSDCFACRVFSLSHSLDNDVSFLLFRQPNLPSIPVGFSDVYLWNPDASLLEKMQATMGDNMEQMTWHNQLVPLWRLNLP